jgi:hypothetical protein
MYGKYRRKNALIEMKSANPEYVSIILKKKFAKAANGNANNPELASLNKIMEKRDLKLESYSDEMDKLGSEINELEPKFGAIDKYFITPVFKAIAGRIAKTEAKKTNMFETHVPFEDLEEFIGELASKEVSPIIKKVYAGQTRVL